MPETLHDLWTACDGGIMYSRTNAPQPRNGVAPVVLVHGMVISSAYMVPAAECLAPLCPVYAPDLPGYGRSWKPDRTLSLPELADAIAHWMRALGMPRAHFVGNSFGCQVIAEFAVRHANRVDRLVMQGPTVDAEARTLPRQFVRMWRNSRREPHGLGRISRHDYRAAGWRRVIGTVRVVMRDRLEEKLPLIRAPTLVVRGTRDPMVPREWADRIVALLPQGELREIEGGTHTLNFFAPDALVRAVAPFLGLGVGVRR